MDELIKKLKEQLAINAEIEAEMTSFETKKFEDIKFKQYEPRELLTEDITREECEQTIADCLSQNEEIRGEIKELKLYCERLKLQNAERQSYAELIKVQNDKLKNAVFITLDLITKIQRLKNES